MDRLLETQGCDRILWTSIYGRGGSNPFSLSPGPAGQFSFHKSVFFSLLWVIAAVWVEFELSSKADMSDAIGEFRFVPLADITTAIKLGRFVQTKEQHTLVWERLLN